MRRVHTTGARPAALIGPTAVGKTSVAILVARQLNAEIVSVDSRQVYRELDIGTAKPTHEEQAQARHHLLDVVAPTEPFSAANFQSAADLAIKDIHGRGRLALLAGGAGLYYRAVVDGLFEGPGADPAVRSRLEAEADELGSEALHVKLTTVDPEAAHRIHPNDRMRLVRALEVHELTGRPISEHQRQSRSGPARYDVTVIGLRRPRETLNRRANLRIKKMLSDGLVDEVARLRDKYRRSDPAFDGFGYREIWEHLDGRCVIDRAVELLRRHTHRYAKRQMTWFRADRRVHWLDVADDETPELTAERVCARLDDAHREPAAGA